MRDTIETTLNEDGIYRANRNSKNVATYAQSELDWRERNPQGALGVLKDGDYINDALINMSKEIIQNSNQLNYQMRTLENSIDRYWNDLVDYRHIKNNKHREYNDLISDQNNLLNDIDKRNNSYGLWRYKDDFYYRASPQSELCIGNAEKISKEISSRYPINVRIVDDLNDISNNIKEIRFDTVFISKKSIIVIDGEVIEPTQQYEIFKHRNGKFYRNLIVTTESLTKRFENYNKNSSESTKTKVFIQKISTYSDSKFLLNRLGKSFESLKSENIIVMVGNKNVSEDIFCNRVFKPMIHPENHITITDDILKEKSIAEILRGKLFIYVTHIPENLELRKKLKELFIQVSLNKYFYMENQKINTYAQIIVTLDKEDHFIKDFAHLSSIFYINPLDDILSEMNEINDVSLIGNIEASLMNFAEELCVIGNQQTYNQNNEYFYNYSNGYSSGNKRFLGELEEAYEVTNQESETGLPILDPYSNDFENIIANNNRFKHTYIMANQGFGKSQLIISLIMRDYLLNDSSVVLLDPHGDLSEDLFRLIKDKERLLYIDPYLDNSITPTINIFDIVENNEDSIHEVSQVIITVLKTINSDDKFSGPMEDVAENCIKVLLREGGGSFLELYKFLNGGGSKDWLKLGKNSPIEIEAEFFNIEFESSKQTIDALKRRLKKLLNDPKFSSFMNGKSKINLEQLVNTKGKIIIINISSGKMPNTYQYYMKFLVGYLQLIALKRLSIPIEQRTYTQLYLDEFHLFLDNSRIFEEMLTGARKLRMFVNFAHQTVAQIRDSNLKEILTTIPTRYFIGNIANKSIDILSNALNAELDNPESLITGLFYYQEDNKKPFKIQNTDKFLDDKENLSFDEQMENLKYIIDNYYRPIKPKTASQPTFNEIKEMIQQFKNDFISKNLTETSCLYKLEISASERFKEIKSDFEFRTAKDNEYKPRIRQQEISVIFSLAFELDYTFDNAKFIQMLKGENDMFNQSSSGTRTAEFTADGKSKTEQYYYFEW